MNSGYSKRDEINIIKKAKGGCKKSRDEFITSNLGLVKHNASLYEWSGLSFDDLVQEGSIGLIKALDTFDLEKNCKFATHATIYIKKYINMFIPSQYKSVNIPDHMYARANKIAISKSKLSEFIDNPTALDISNDIGLTIKQVKNSLSLSQPHVHLDMTQEDSRQSLHDTLMCEKIDNESLNNHNLLNGEIKEFINNLSTKEKRVINLRYGMNAGSKMTLKEVSEIIGVTYQGVKVIEDRAIMKLRCLDGIEELEKYLYE